ncbi:hypothetical protein BX666DRAFT_1908362 [Dichotomocladium elegans]|nr:hypothetical protein BX666DRAFT_1908362 [Dichotomocladium elegans]
MLDTPSAGLQASLKELFTSAEQFAADVCFEYPNRTIWAHRAIILARSPKAFCAQYLPELLQVDAVNCRRVTIYPEPVLPEHVLYSLLRFWYTAEYEQTDQSGATSPGSGMLPTDGDLLGDILIHEASPIIPLIISSDNEKILLGQLVADIVRMYEYEIAADVTVTVSSGPESTSFNVHRFILALKSSYFNAMFCKSFSEAASPVVQLPSDVFSPAALRVIIGYYYTNQLQITTPHDQTALIPNHECNLTQKTHMLRILQEAFRIADYLSQYDTVCVAVLHAMANIYKQYKCACGDCAALLPSMLWFADKYVPELRQGLTQTFSDPVYAPAMLWSSETFGILAESKPGLIAELVTRMTNDIKKQNAIQVLESLYLCLTRTRNSAVRDLMNGQLVNFTIRMISDNFGFYCVEYPILLSCVDGIAVGSVDFLEFLLMQVVQHGINDKNAADLYQGIARDLIGRQEMDQNGQVDSILLNAKHQCIEYISKNWSKIKAQGGFKSVEKEMLRRLSEDIDIPYRTLTKSFDTDLASLFSFKSKKRNNNSDNRGNERRRNSAPHSSHSYHSYRRLSLLSLRSRRSHDSLATTSSRELSHKRPILTPSQSLPVSPAIATISMNHASPNPSSSSSSSSILFDALLPTESAAAAIPHVTTPTSAMSNRRPSCLSWDLPRAPQRPAMMTSRSATAARPVKKKKERSRSPLRYRFGFGCDSRDDEDDPPAPVLGARIELLRRPLPLLGTIKFIGPVHFAKGIYVGVELESRLGSNDGSYEGHRYFSTDTQRGTFCKIDDFKIISFPRSS